MVWGWEGAVWGGATLKWGVGQPQTPGPCRPCPEHCLHLGSTEAGRETGLSRFGFCRHCPHGRRTRVCRRQLGTDSVE